MVQNVMNTCGVDKAEAIQLIKEEIELARENFAADGDLYRAIKDVLSGLGLDMDYEMQVAQMICA